MRPNLTEKQRWAIFVRATIDCDEDSLRLKAGAGESTAKEFGVSIRSVRNVIGTFKKQRANGIDFPNMDGNRIGNCGRKSLLTEELKEAIKRVNREEHGMCTMRGLVIGLEDLGFEVEIHSLFNYLIEMHPIVLRVHAKPTLTEAQRWARLSFVLDQIDKRNPLVYSFFGQYNRIYLDEKWFYICNITGNKVRVFEGDNVDEMLAATHIHSKAHPIKVMVLVAVGRPQRKPDGSIFDGKIGLWAFSESKSAQRASKNRLKGVMEMKSVTVTADIYRHKLIGAGGVLDAVKEKMSWLHGEDIELLQDGAKPHIGHHNVGLINEAGQVDGWKISISTQPAQSPDLNKLDLCFFWGLQKSSDRLKWHARTLDDLLEAVSTAFDEYDGPTLERCHGCLIADYVEVMKCQGGNNFRTPHSGVRRRQNALEDVASFNVDVAMVNRLQSAVNAHFAV